MPGSQTIFRSLDILEAVAEGATVLDGLAHQVGLTRSTAHRIAAALVERRYLNYAVNEGYSLGPKLLDLGSRASLQVDVTRVARPHLEKLSAETGDTVHLGVIDDQKVLYLDILPGQRRIVISSRVGERNPVTSTGLGKSLILDEDEATWTAYFNAESSRRRTGEALKHWLKRMHEYREAQYTFDLEENEDRIRCVAAPIRNAAGRVTAALSVTSAAQYMSDARMSEIAETVQNAARRISEDLGFSPKSSAPGPGPAADKKRRRAKRA